MSWQQTPYTIPLLVAGMTSVILAIHIYIRRREEAPGGTTGTLIMLAGAAWMLGYAVELAATTLEAKVLSAKVEYICIAIVPTALLIYTLQYTGREKWVTARMQFLLSIIPAVLVGLVLTNEAHGLIWKHVSLNTKGPFVVLDRPYGIGFLAYGVYLYSLLFLASLPLIQLLMRSRHLYRWQTSALLLGVLAPSLAGALDLLGLGPFPYLKLTPLAFTVTSLTVGWSLFRLRLGDIVPVAREAIIESISDGVLVLDPQNRIVDLNPAAQRLIRKAASEAIGCPIGEAWPDWPGQMSQANDAPGFGKEVVVGEGETQRTYDVRISPLKDWRDRLISRVVVLRDMTAYKRAERALASEKERLAVTLRSIGDGVITTDTEGSVVLINKVAEELTGWTQEQAAGRPLTEVFQMVHERTREHCEDPVERVLASVGSVELPDHTLLIHKDGTERIIADSGAAIRDKNSSSIGVVLVFRDITERRRMEEELLRAQKLDSVGLLAGGIAHDFNNFLVGILGNISLASMEADAGDRILDRLAAVEKACMRAKGLTQQLLTFSKGGAPVKKSASITELIRESADFAVRGSGVRCEFVLPESIWLVEVDESQISHVIHNLMINANQAMPGGGIIRVWAENITIGAEHGLPVKDGRCVKICIQDRGIGIPAEHLPKIFDPYFTTKRGGSGLGLATAYSIIKKHDGHITAKSSPSMGTVLTIYLPATQKSVEGHQRVTESTVTGRGKILVMDDEETIRDVTGRMLRVLGYEVEFAKDGDEAIATYVNARAAGKPFDGVIMDLTIPGGMGGKEAISRLREIDPQVRALVSSGYSNDPVMAEFGRYGFGGIVVKPYRIQELSNTLQNVINGNQATLHR